MALTNPNKAVSVERLNYFKNKLGDVFASKTHTHSNATTSSAGFMSASDKTKLDGLTPSTGVLEVEKGGTGQSTLTTNSVIAGNGTNAVKNISSASGALYATASGGVPKFGTLPVAQGGTGSSYSDFSALCDAVGSGGNWIDVGEKFTTEIISLDAKVVYKQRGCFIYERRFMCLEFSAQLQVSVPAFSINDHHKFTLPSWALPKRKISSSDTFNIANIWIDGSVHLTNIQAVGAGGVLGINAVYPLATPYTE